jgi:hypothetical protein
VDALVDSSIECTRQAAAMYKEPREVHNVAVNCVYQLHKIHAQVSYRYIMSIT